jgi:CHAT domain-containing protein
MKQIDDILFATRKKLLSLLAKAKDFEKLNYWNSRFNRAEQRRTELSAVANNKKLLPLLTAVSRYENVRQILITEENKPEAQRNKKLILSAKGIKKEIEKQFETIREQLDEDEIKKFQSALSDDFIIRPNALKQLSYVLPSDVACIQCLLVGDTIVVYLTIKDMTPFVSVIKLKDKSLSEKAFRSKLVKFRTLLQADGSSRLIMKEANELYNIIFADLEKSLSHLKIKKLIFNASGFLRYIPFAALYDGKSYLVEKYHVTNITGLDLIRLSKKNENHKINSMEAVIFANPDGSLPASQKEAEDIGKLFPKKQCYLGKNATLENFETLLGKINFIHLATHAKLNSDAPEESYIEFANKKRWRYIDMMSFDIKNVDLIVLSACSTAVKPSSAGTEVESFAAQLLKNSPTGSIVASFWDVDDVATASFMAVYYQNIVESIKKNGTLDRGGALRKAQLHLLRNPATASPRYWAAFTLFGDFR